MRFSTAFSSHLLLLPLPLLQLLLCCCVSVRGKINDVSRYQFGSDLWRGVLPNYGHQNVAVAPLALQHLLALLYRGAGGSTAAELLAGLRLDDYATKEEVLNDYRWLLNLNYRQGGRAEAASRIYVNQGRKIAPQFREDAFYYFDLDAENVNFADSGETADKINKWIERRSEHKIRDFITPAKLESNTEALLVSAVYFAARWLYEFDAAATIEQDFFLTANDSVKVPMMNQSGVPVQYCQSAPLDLRAVKLSLRDTSAEMLVLLPNKIDNVIELHKQLTVQSLEALEASCVSAHVNLLLPKFKFETYLNLKPHLEHLGIRSCFTNESDFSKMLTEEKSLEIKDVLHKVSLNVDEQGAHAAELIRFKDTLYARKNTHRQFIADRPFAFAIKDDHALYIVGHITKPPGAT